MSKRTAAPGYHADDVVVQRLAFESRPELRGSKSLPEPVIDFHIQSTIDRKAKQIVSIAMLKAADPKGKRAPFVATATIAALFSWEEPLQLPVEDFAKLNAAGFLWPYARELIWNSTVRAGLPPLMLPILNFSTVRVEVVEEGVTARIGPGGE